MANTPFNGGGWILPARVDQATALAAARMLARLAGGDRDALITALEALGLIPYREPA